MRIIINSSFMTPIYEQIVEQIKAQILSGELERMIPAVLSRTLSKELRISALTVKKAYDSLEQEGFTITVHGKGTYVAAANKEMMMEEYRREIEEDLTEVIRKAKTIWSAGRGYPGDAGADIGGIAYARRLEHVKKQYQKFTLDCSLEVKPRLHYRFDRTVWSGKVHDI